MKIIGHNPKTDSLIPIELSQDGLAMFPKYVGRKAWWSKRTSCRPRQGALTQNEDTIKVWFEDTKRTQVWHKSYFVQKITL